jgi:hypothetical protein
LSFYRFFHDFETSAVTMLSEQLSILTFITTEVAFVLSATCIHFWVFVRALRRRPDAHLPRQAPIIAYIGLPISYGITLAMTIVACVLSTKTEYQASIIALEQGACVSLVIAEVSFITYLRL